MKEFEILLSRLDHSHQFSESPSPSLLCSRCGKIRALHYDDGFHPNHQPSGYTTDPAVRFRGPHPRWSRPQSVRVDKSEEAEIAASPKRRAQAEAIRREEQRQINRCLQNFPC